MKFHDKKIYISGHNGMVGKACIKVFKNSGYNNLIVSSSKDLDLRCQKSVNEFLSINKPDIIINAAAKVGGILANNNFPYEFLMDNMLIQNNLLDFAFKNNIQKFIFLGSSCIYPKMADQPIKEEYLLNGQLEITNEWYAIAKISGVKVIQALNKQYNRDYLALMPTNLYGDNDNYDLNTSHVLPAMIRKFHEAKINGNRNVLLLGSGEPLREFLHVDDLAKIILFFTENSTNESLLNVGSGNEIKIKDLAYLVKKIINFKGSIKWDKSKPDGTPRKLLDSSKLLNINNFEFKDFEQGIIETYDSFEKKYETIKKN